MVESAANKRVPTWDEMVGNVPEDWRDNFNEFYENNQWRHDHVDKYGWTLLMRYIGSSRLAAVWIVQYLLDNTAHDINLQDNCYGLTALSRAFAKDAQIEVLELLCRRGAKVLQR